MNFYLQRLYHTLTNPKGNFTAGFITNDAHSFRSWNLEDGVSPTGQKVKGITRIPGNLTYVLGLRKELTDLTKKHREDYKTLPWFKDNPNWFHIEILNVKDFSGIYFHGGRDDKDTLGCQLPAYQFDISTQDYPSAKSMLAVCDFYSIVHPLLDKGTEVLYHISDEIR